MGFIPVIPHCPCSLAATGVQRCFSTVLLSCIALFEGLRGAPGGSLPPAQPMQLFVNLLLPEPQPAWEPLWLVQFPIRWHVYSHLHACRVGEAQNPGPKCSAQRTLRHFFAGVPDSPSSSDSRNSILPGFRLAVANLTSVHANMAEVMPLGADVVCLAETSAVEQVQHSAAAEFRRHGYSSCWSSPVSAHTREDADQPSLRGHAAGAAVLVRGPSRPVFNEVPPDLAQSLRYAEAVVRIGPQEALVVALYGFPSNHPDAQDQNQQLLSLTLQRVMSLGLPAVVAGDFNTRVVDLPVWEQFLHCGFHELHQSFQARFGKSLPNTCCGATAHDSMLLSQSLFPLLQHAWVDTDGHLFSAHAPVHVTLSVPRLPLSYQAWRLPDSWEALDPDPTFVEVCPPCFGFRSLGRGNCYATGIARCVQDLGAALGAGC